MKIINIPLPENESSRYFDNAELSPSELEELKVIPQLTEVRYYYGQGSYEGHGWMLLRIADSWRVYSLDHCSCYGPLEHLYHSCMPLSAADFEELKAKCTAEVWEAIEPLTKV